MRAALLAPVLLVLALAGCAAADEGEVRVAAAASLNSAFEEIVAEFEKAHPDIDVAPVVYDGSSTLAVQVEEGAPIDVVAFANEPTMERIADVTTEPRIFATNTLVIAVPTGSAGIEDLDDLTDPALDVVVCAEEVPCGAATVEALQGAGIDLDAASYEQNVTAVALKVQNATADAGLVYRTDAAATEGVEAVEDPRLDAVVNRYPIALARDAGDGAQAFADFVLSDAGQAVLAEWGFGTP